MFLSKVADVLQKRGQARHALWDEDGSVCALGALYVAATGENISFDTQHQPWFRSDTGRGLIKRMADALKLPHIACSVEHCSCRQDAVAKWSNSTTTSQLLSQLRAADAQEEAKMIESLDFDLEATATEQVAELGEMSHAIA